MYVVACMSLHPLILIQRKQTERFTKFPLHNYYYLFLIYPYHDIYSYPAPYYFCFLGFCTTNDNYSPDYLVLHLISSFSKLTYGYGKQSTLLVIKYLTLCL